jgi:limonene-1,2-epoxide hydrolase
MADETPALTDVEQIRALWSNTYNTQGKPDWSHIFPYYRDDIVFRDSVQETRGIEAFRGVCQRLTDRCQELEMTIEDIAMEGRVVFMEWEMTMIFQRTPKSTVYGCTKLTLDERGRITHQRDYYDLWGDIFDNIPGVARGYRRFMHRVFG